MNEDSQLVIVGKHSPTPSKLVVGLIARGRKDAAALGPPLQERSDAENESGFSCPYCWRNANYEWEFACTYCQCDAEWDSACDYCWQWMYQNDEGEDPSYEFFHWTLPFVSIYDGFKFQDPKDAFEMYSTVVQSYAPAEFTFGYYMGDNAEQVLRYRSAAGKGYAPAQFNLGWKYEKREGVERDYPEAARLYTLAAIQGYAPAQARLGWMYEKGLGVKRDYSMAIELYRAAADQDYPPAQYSLGEVSDQGPEMTNDNAEALGWYQKAADRGYAPAQRAIEWARQCPTNHV